MMMPGHLRASGIQIRHAVSRRGYYLVQELLEYFHNSSSAMADYDMFFQDDGGHSVRYMHLYSIPAFTM
jgi:uncharacterized protein VirK/YbjX